MRILIAGQTYAPAFNGQAVFTTNLAQGLAARGHQVLVLLPSDRVRPYRCQRQGVTLHYLPSLPLWMFHSDTNATLLARPLVEPIFRRFRPQLVHVQDHYPLSRSVVKVARASNVPALGTNHFMPENLAPYIPFSTQAKPLFDWAMWKILVDFFNRLDMATAPSVTAARILRQQGLQVPVHPVSCGVPLERFHPDPGLDREAVRRRFGLDPAAITFLFVGRVDAEKRLDVLLRALPELGREDVQLAIAGQGEALGELKRLASQLGQTDRVHFLGFVADEELPALLNSVDLFAMPSEAELLSIATLEAMAAGRPVLAARAQALPELVEPGRNGYLFRPGDPGDAARFMAELVDHPQRWAAMGQASQERAWQHSLENTVTRYEGLYQQLLTTVPRLQPVYPRLRPQGLLGRLMRGRIQEVMDQLWR